MSSKRNQVIHCLSNRILHYNIHYALESNNNNFTSINAKTGILYLCDLSIISENTSHDYYCPAGPNVGNCPRLVVYYDEASTKTVMMIIAFPRPKSLPENQLSAIEIG